MSGCPSESSAVHSVEGYATLTLGLNNIIEREGRERRGEAIWRMNRK